MGKGWLCKYVESTLQEVFFGRMSGLPTVGIIGVLAYRLGGVSRWRPTDDMGGQGREMEDEEDVNAWCWIENVLTTTTGSRNEYSAA